MSDELERSLAEKMMKILDGHDPRVVYKSLMYTTLSVMVHEAKGVGDTNISWNDKFRVLGANYNQQLKQHIDRTAAKNENVLASAMIHLPGRGVQ